MHLNPMFVTHPSIRIRGTENNYMPMQCLDQNCSHQKTPHMHCPFCQKNDIYNDPIILKAHYRVKHVDKGIDFAGLKILRCCEHCDIIGAIKGEKKFKGAHWHCYKCKNGFNRRDEAIKHYKTHFRNPHTTFQIQILQEVNQTIPQYEEQVITALTRDGLDPAMIPVLTEAVMNNSENASVTLNNENDSSMVNGKEDVSVAANETIDASDNPAIMIIQDEQIEDAESCQMLESHEISSTEMTLEEQKEQLERRVEELLQQAKTEAMLHKNVEGQLRTEIIQLKLKVQMQQHDIAMLKKREDELNKQMNIPLDARLQNLMTTLQVQHLELLQQQLFQVRQVASSVNNEMQIKEESIAIPKTTCIDPSTTGHTVVAYVMDGSTDNFVPYTLDSPVNAMTTYSDSVDACDSSQDETEHNPKSPLESDNLVIVDIIPACAEDEHKRVCEYTDSDCGMKKRKK